MWELRVFIRESSSLWSGLCGVLRADVAWGLLLDRGGLAVLAEALTGDGEWALDAPLALGAGWRGLGGGRGWFSGVLPLRALFAR